MKILLASQSPRRKELFSLTDIPFSTASPAIAEVRQEGESPLQYVSRLSLEKAEAFSEAASRNTWILAADTIVSLGDTVLEKPQSAQEAHSILTMLKGKTHLVYTSLTILRGRFLPMTTVVVSEVPMRNYAAQEIETYIASGDPFDKAGAYAIQHQGFHPVDNFTGCFANVMGLPLCDLTVLLSKSGLTVAPGIEIRCQGHLGYDCPVCIKILQGNSIDKCVKK